LSPFRVVWTKVVQSGVDRKVRILLRGFEGFLGRFYRGIILSKRISGSKGFLMLTNGPMYGLSPLGL
jgi:hypothetical protein